ncbi:hypothetical protein OCV51_07600 [Faecalicatena acetigenes]|uniref:Uncharacterized protein n=1 Tax=Faecalicatena acetigenes TaxID=2981790 RepID=A0ABT2TCR5_9FIRM|nr:MULTISPECIES: hypothetical protein [Lachnospiraceae]MCU6747519.1 hypothetical protein [Faecalicatena acetigenes]SCH93553.1 Uncharacterised protein [uncultured Clostridium sp.]
MEVKREVIHKKTGQRETICFPCDTGKLREIFQLKGCEEDNLLRFSDIGGRLSVMAFNYCMWGLEKYEEKIVERIEENIQQLRKGGRQSVALPLSAYEYDIWNIFLRKEYRRRYEGVRITTFLHCLQLKLT